MIRMLARAARAALLTSGIYNQAGNDPMAILHATGVVMLAGMSLGLGLTGAMIDAPQKEIDLARIENRIVWLWIVIMITMVGWIVWAGVSYLLGSRLLGGKAGFRKLLRALGIVYGPGALLILLQVPVLGDIFSVIALVWILIAGVVAMHEVEEIDWLNAVLATIPGWFVGIFLVPAPVLGPLLGPL